MLDQVSAGPPAVLTGGELAYSALRARILANEFPANAVLREQALAEELGVSRTPVREALRRLAEAGLVEFVPNRGATVVSWTREQMAETYFVRAALESRAAGLAAPQIDDAVLSRLHELILGMDEFVNATDIDSVSELGRLNSEFHRLVVTASGSKQLMSLVATVSQVPMMIRNFKDFGSTFRSRSNHHHRDIVTALESGDTLWAEVAMRSHILAARNAVLQAPDSNATNG
jgi:DNA-binding GntR family transcriptional regulator